MPVSRRAILLGGLAAPVASLTSAAAGRGTNLDPLGVRADFAITEGGRIFLNSAYTAPLCRPIISAGRQAAQQQVLAPDQDGPDTGQEIRVRFARLINASPDEIAIMHSTAEGENLVAWGLGLKSGDNVVMSSLNYDNQYILYRVIERELGVQLRIVPHREGRVEARDMAPHVDSRTRLISVALVSHQNGYVHDLKSIAELAHAHGGYLFADATQAAGAVPIDVKGSNVDFLCSNSYKWLLGSYGVTPLYIRRDLLDRIHSNRYGEGMVSRRLGNRQYEFFQNARRFEYSSLVLIPGAQLAASLSYIERIGPGRIESYLANLGLKLQRGLLAQGRKLFTPPDNRSPIVAFYMTQSPESAKAIYRKAGISLTARDGTVRISPAIFNNDADLDRCLEVTKQIT
jgi:selenocysteine lyase/cysteine desulfurase